MSPGIEFLIFLLTIIIIGISLGTWLDKRDKDTSLVKEMRAKKRELKQLSKLGIKVDDDLNKIYRDKKIAELENKLNGQKD